MTRKPTGSAWKTSTEAPGIGGSGRDDGPACGARLAWLPARSGARFEPLNVADEAVWARRAVLAHYIRVVEEIIEQLSSSEKQAGVSETLKTALAEYANAHRLDDSAYRTRATEETYRAFLAHVLCKLRATVELPGPTNTRETQYAYPSAAAFAADLNLVRDSLNAHRGGRLARPKPWAGCPPHKIG